MKQPFLTGKKIGLTAEEAEREIEALKAQTETSKSQLSELKRSTSKMEEDLVFIVLRMVQQDLLSLDQAAQVYNLLSPPVDSIPQGITLGKRKVREAETGEGTLPNISKLSRKVGIFANSTFSTSNSSARVDPSDNKDFSFHFGQGN